MASPTDLGGALIQVVMADDHPVVRAGLRALLEAEDCIRVVGEAADGEEALALVASLEPDVLLLDVQMPDISGVEVARRMTERTESVTRIIALSSHEDPEYVRGMMNGGASGYLTKEQAPYLIVDSVRAVAQGEVRWFVRLDDQESRVDRLTDRERDVLCQIARGKSNRDVASVLHISENTVRTHSSRIYDKLEVASGREAIALAWQTGFMGNQS